MYRQKGMQVFRKWLQEQQVNQEQKNAGISCQKIELNLIDDATGYGLFAKEDINLDEILIEIPEKFIISAQFVANLPEYAEILKRFRLEPSEILVLFFAFEHVYFEHHFEQKDEFDNMAYHFEYDEVEAVENFCVFRSFLRYRMSRIHTETGLLWWKPYLDILPREFCTPLFKYYLAESGEMELKNLAAQLPQQAKEKLVAQIVELKLLEQKLMKIIYSIEETVEYQVDKDDEELAAFPLLCKIEDATNDKSQHIAEKADLLTFWREIFCWAWHIVNTRCIFIDNLPFHPLVDSLPKGNAENGEEIVSTKSATFPNRRFSNRKGRRKSEYDDEEFGGSLALIPLVDLLNHSPDGQCTPSFDRNSKSYLVRAGHHTLRKGEQLFVCYGAHDDVQLWIDYGFRMEDNPFNKVTIPIELFIALAERCGARVNSIRRDILAKANLPCTIYASEDLPSYALRKNCSILILPKEKLANWSRHIFSQNDDDLEEINDREFQLLKAILERLRNALCARREECEYDEARSLWTDQIQILQRMLKNLDEIYQ